MAQQVRKLAADNGALCADLIAALREVMRTPVQRHTLDEILALVETQHAVISVGSFWRLSAPSLLCAFREANIMPGWLDTLEDLCGRTFAVGALPDVTGGQVELPSTVRKPLFMESNEHTLGKRLLAQGLLHTLHVPSSVFFEGVPARPSADAPLSQWVFT